MTGWTCRDIYNAICDHTDGISIYICVHGWANERGGKLVAQNVEEDVFLAMIGNNVPVDWHISSGDDGVDIGFLF